MQRIRLSRKKLPLPNSCIACSEDCSGELNIDIKFKPKDKNSNPFKDFILKGPVCETHHNTYQKGSKIGKIAFILMGTSVVPFILGLILMAALDMMILALFIIGLIMGGVGYFLLSPSNRLLSKSGKGMIIIDVVTADDIILSVRNDDYAKILRELESSKGWKARLKNK